MVTKDEIARCYLELGVEKGFDNVSLQDIADKTGLRKASLYSHFENYSQLERYAVEYAGSCLAEQNFGVNFSAENMETLLGELLDSFITVFTVPQAYGLLMIAEQKKTYNTAYGELSDRLDMMINARMQVALEYCVQRSWTDIGDTDEVSLLFSTALRSHLVKSNLTDTDIDSLLHTFLHILR